MTFIPYPYISLDLFTWYQGEIPLPHKSFWNDFNPNESCSGVASHSGIMLKENELRREMKPHREATVWPQSEKSWSSFLFSPKKQPYGQNLHHLCFDLARKPRTRERLSLNRLMILSCACSTNFILVSCEQPLNWHTFVSTDKWSKVLYLFYLRHQPFTL